MSVQQRIAERFERVLKALTLRPTMGQTTAVNRVVLRDGLAIDVEEGPWTLAVDMPETLGGAGRAPTPGVYGRAAFGACLAIGYAQEAARMGIALDRLEVEVQADMDSRGEMGVEGIEPGYLEVRWVVTVETRAPESDVHAMLERAERRSPYLSIFSRPHPARRELRYTHRA